VWVPLLFYPPHPRGAHGWDGMGRPGQRWQVRGRFPGGAACTAAPVDRKLSLSSSEHGLVCLDRRSSKNLKL
jgi:hypothetical protein